MSTIYYTASSVDGFIADAENSLGWLLSRQVDAKGPMGYDAFYAGVGAMVMGATTYQWLLDNHDGPWPHEVPAWVFTHRDFPEPSADIRFTRSPVEEVHREMVAVAGDRNVWVAGGGGLAGQFAEAGLLDEMWVQYAPVSLGRGAPLLPSRVELELCELAQNGEFACARYRVLRR